MQLGWLSDIHLNFLDGEQLAAFVDELATTKLDAWLISGDIGEADCVLEYLQHLAIGLARPVYFVLGNHDFYWSSIAAVETKMAAPLSPESLTWLTSAEPCFLNDDLAIVGDDGWSDGRLGDPQGSCVELNDFHRIRELKRLTRQELVRTTNALGDRSAARLTPKLEAAAGRCENVCVVTHVPPFAGAAWYNGRTCEPDWLPWFSCTATGEVLLDCAARHLRTQFVVLCGHTHGRGIYEAAPNVIVYTAGVQYGRPELQGTIVQKDKRVCVMITANPAD